MSGFHKKGSALLIVVLGTIVLLASSPARAEFDFETWRPYPAGDGPSALAMADLDNDGIQDLAIINAQDNRVAAILGDGEGGFGTLRRTSVLEDPRAIAAGDLDGDGIADLAVAAVSGMQVLPGNGNGTFEPGSLLMTGTNFSDIAIADLNDDAHLDLVAITAYDDSVAVLLGNGDGTFQAAMNFDLEHGWGSVAVGLLNGDQVPDLVVAHGYWTGVEVLLGNGDGSFQDAVSYPAGDNPSSVTIGDLDGDGHNDLAVANNYDDELWVLLGQGDGTFPSSVTYSTGVEPRVVAVADLDDDGNPDLVTANGQGCTASLLLGNGDGTFQPAEDLWAGSGPQDLAIDDFDMDGAIDLALTSTTADSVCVLIGRGDGSFISPPTVPVGEAPKSVALADFDQDGHPDAATANNVGESVSVLLGDGQGSFLPAVEYALSGRASRIVAEDLDHDGMPDLVASMWDGYVAVLLGNGDGTFQSAVDYFCAYSAEFVTAVQMNGDDHLDLVLCNNEDYDSNVTILLGNGDGTFQPALFNPDLAINYAGLATLDMDGDGDLDVAVGDGFISGISLLLNNGDGTLVLHEFMYMEDWVFDLDAKDLNEDSITDLVVLGSSWAHGPSVGILFGRPAGFFEDPVYFPTSFYPSSFLAEDLDGDGHLDLVTANQGYQIFSVLRGYGDGTFSPPRLFGAAGQPSALAAGQLDGEGMPDLVMPNQLGDELSILINASDINRLAIAGPGPGYDNPPLVRVFRPGQGGEPLVEFPAYGPERYGVNVACGRLTGTGQPEILTGAGPGQIYGPHVRGFTVQGQPLAGLSFFAYGTLKYGVNVAAGDIDGDGYDEIITGAGPGAVFGPHVRAWDYDGTPGVTPVPGVSYFAYGTPKWGVNVAAGDIDGDGYDEIVTGPGPGDVYGPHIRGWNVDGGSASAISGVSYLAYGTNKKGAKVTCGDVDGDGIDEIVTSPGPSSFFASHVRGWNYDGAAVSAISGLSFFAWPAEIARYGANVEAGTDLDGDGRADLLVGGGPDPSIGTGVKVFTYDGSQVSEWVAFEAFPGMTEGCTVAAGGF